MLPETRSERQRALLDVFAPTVVLRLAAGWVRSGICRGNAMVSSANRRTVANLGIASALALSLGGCGSYSLPSLSSPTAAPEPSLAPEMPRPFGQTRLLGAGVLHRTRIPPTGRAPRLRPGRNASSLT